MRTRTRATLKTLEAAAEEAKRERQIHLTNEPDPDPLVRTLYRLRHDLVMIGRARAAPFPEPLAMRLAPRTAEPGQTLSVYMQDLAVSLRTGAPAPPHRSRTSCTPTSRMSKRFAPKD